MADVCVQILMGVMNNLAPFIDGRIVSCDMCESIVLCLEIAYRELIVLEFSGDLSDEQRRRADIIKNCISLAQDMQRLSESFLARRDRPIPPIAQTGHPGRPKYVVSHENLEFLLEHQFTVPHISRILGVFVSTVRRRMTDCGLFVRSFYSYMFDSELDEIVRSIHQDYPMCGNAQMRGFLISRGYRVQQFRIRESLRRVDIIGTSLRRLTVLNRRHYSVPRY